MVLLSCLIFWVMTLGLLLVDCLFLVFCLACLLCSVLFWWLFCFAELGFDWSLIFCICGVFFFILDFTGSFDCGVIWLLRHCDCGLLVLIGLRTFGLLDLLFCVLVRYFYLVVIAFAGLLIVVCFSVFMVGFYDCCFLFAFGIVGLVFVCCLVVFMFWVDLLANLLISFAVSDCVVCLDMMVGCLLLFCVMSLTCLYLVFVVGLICLIWITVEFCLCLFIVCLGL